MANDGERPPTAAEKGKGKVDDANDLKGDGKEDEVMKDADGKPIANGKKGDEPKQGTWPMAQHSLYGSKLVFRRASREVLSIRGLTQVTTL